MTLTAVNLKRKIRKPLFWLTLSVLALLYASNLPDEVSQPAAISSANYSSFSEEGGGRGHVITTAPNGWEEWGKSTASPKMEGRRGIDESKNAPSRNTPNLSSERNQRRLNNSLPSLKIELDFSRKYFPLWRKDPECSQYKVQFAKFKAFPKCGLTSYPGSGNTWLRRLIEDASGIFTGSVYNDGQLYLAGHYGEFEPWFSGTTVAQKSHDFSSTSVKQFEGRGIVLMRNPYRAIMAFHNYLFAGHHLYAPLSNYRRKDWPSFVHLQAKHWLETFMTWLKGRNSVHVVHYENLRRNPSKELRKILTFLKVPVDEKRLHCIQKHTSKSFRRKEQRFPDSLVVFRNETRDKIDRAIRYASYLLKKKGQETPPTELYEFYNGTSSEEITFVPCEKDETEIECDARVGNINIEMGMKADRNNFVFIKKVKGGLRSPQKKEVRSSFLIPGSS